MDALQKACLTDDIANLAAEAGARRGDGDEINLRSFAYSGDLLFDTENLHRFVALNIERQRRMSIEKSLENRVGITPEQINRLFLLVGEENGIEFVHVGRKEGEPLAFSLDEYETELSMQGYSVETMTIDHAIALTDGAR